MCEWDVCVYVRVCVSLREIVCVCTCVCEREIVCVREIVYEWVCVCERVCVYMSHREREKKLLSLISYLSLMFFHRCLTRRNAVQVSWMLRVRPAASEIRLWCALCVCVCTRVWQRECERVDALELDLFEKWRKCYSSISLSKRRLGLSALRPWALIDLLTSGFDQSNE